jgi:hypothetical protein
MVTTTDWTGAQRASTLAAIAAAESPAEAALLVHLLFALDGDTYAVGGPGCSWRLTTQLKVTVERGRYRLDIALERDPHRVCVEVDGYAYHSTEAQKAHDAARELALKATGWTVIRVAAWRAQCATSTQMIARSRMRCSCKCRDWLGPDLVSTRMSHDD